MIYVTIPNLKYYATNANKNRLMYYLVLGGNLIKYQ